MRSRDDRAAGAAYVRAIVWGSLGLGVLLRVAAYVHNRALWADEALYAREIVTETIDHTVVANMPPLFKLATQLATRTFGTSECALRLFPLLCGLAALALFAVLTAQYLEPRARAIALLLFATSDRLIYFSSELKAYSTDVACALLLTIVGTRALQGPLTTGRAIAFGALGGVLIWCSLPAVFVLAGIGTVIIVSAYLEHDTARLSRGVAAAAIWAVSFGGLYSLTSLRDPDNADCVAYGATGSCRCRPIRWPI
ncbi:MAG: glycosyltransferase family 39 protein [Gemmatimonadaceae bacterium]